jgi:hypothetical protein
LWLFGISIFELTGLLKLPEINPRETIGVDVALSKLRLPGPFSFHHEGQRLTSKFLKTILPEKKNYPRMGPETSDQAHHPSHPSSPPHPKTTFHN